MRTIGVVTTSRADYGIYLPVLRAISAEPSLQLQLIVAGMHLSPEFGRTIVRIEADGFPIAHRLEMLLSSDSPEGIAKSMGVGLMAYAQAFNQTPPDILVVLGDRFEMHAAALAALPFKIPVAHLHGGELTFGAIDDALRHSLTKLSHLHFVSTPEAARRVEQMGEAPWRITVSGAPALDHLQTVQLPTRSELESRLHLRLDPAPLLVTFHPVTLEHESTTHHITELLTALGRSCQPCIFTLPNADTGGREIAQRIRSFVATSSCAWLVENAGTENYYALMRDAGAMVGNSSSGILEAASFRLPVVNIGQRQAGRLRAANVIDCGHTADEIVAAIQTATSSQFRTKLQDLVNPYGDGKAAARIVARLKEITLDQTLLAKQFHDLPQ